MPELVHDGLRYRTHPHVYEPSDDTFLLLASLPTRATGRALEIGPGVGLASLHLARAGMDVTAVDINPAAARVTRDNARRNHLPLEVAAGDALAIARLHVFDLVVCNPPYLPTDPHDRLQGPLNHAFDGGPDGRALLDRLLGRLAIDAPKRTLLVSSTLQGDAARHIRDRGFRVRVVCQKPLSLETLMVLELPADAGPGPR